MSPPWLLVILVSLTGVVQCVLAQCSGPADCSLNGLCQAGVCVCDRPWSGLQCERLEFANPAPAAGRDLAGTGGDPLHNTWNGPMLEENGTYHMYLPLYPAGLLYHPVALMHGTAPERLGPWSWSNLSGVEVSINPGALQYRDPVDGEMRDTLWVSKPEGATVGAVSTSRAAGGPFIEGPGSNSTGCSINPSPLYVNGSFYCTGQKGSTLMRAPAIQGPWAAYATIPSRGEDPFRWVAGRTHWPALFPTRGTPAS